MTLILAFIAGCVFTCILISLCVYVSYTVLQYRNDEVVQKKTLKAVKKHQEETYVPEGGVIRPKTAEEIELDRDGVALAFNDLMKK